MSSYDAFKIMCNEMSHHLCKKHSNILLVLWAVKSMKKCLWCFDMSVNNLLPHLTIVYIEDDDATRESMYSILVKLFKQVFIGRNGEEGLKICLEYRHTIDIIVSDINMPKLSGIALVKAIRKEGLDTPVIFSSAYKESSFLLEAIKLNISDYLVKPYNIRHLLTRVEHICQEKQKQKLILRQKENSNNI